MDLFLEYLLALEASTVANTAFVRAMGDGSQIIFDAALAEAGAGQDALRNARLKLADHKRMHKCYGAQTQTAEG